MTPPMADWGNVAAAAADLSRVGCDAIRQPGGAEANGRWTQLGGPGAVEPELPPLAIVYPLVCPKLAEDAGGEAGALP
jgi:hypothetical protein